MNSVILNPMEEYKTKLSSLHLENTNQFFDQLVKQSGVDIKANQETVKLYHRYRDELTKLKRKRFWLKFLRVVLCITLVGIPFVIWLLTPKIRTLQKEVDEADAKAEEQLSLAQRQMLPLNSLFTDRDGITLIEKTVPSLSFAPSFSVEQESDMRINYDFDDGEDPNQSSLEVLAGHYNENPFLFENVLVHTMGSETYHGHKTIFWTETYRDSNGKRQTRTRSETLHATVTKPKPFYNTRVILHYCAQGGPELSFSRDATNLDEKSEKQIDRYVKRGEKKLRKKTEKALKNNQDFQSMSNSEFEVLFDALNRTDEVQFRTLFTPLAQTNMVDLLLSRVGFGDDFHFVKNRRTNHIVSEHSQGRELWLSAKNYPSYSFDIVKSNFVEKNLAFFKAVYFDFAPLWAIPMYQERPVHSLKPIPSYDRLYSFKEYENLVNRADARHFVHPDTKTQAIIKPAYLSTANGADKTRIKAYSYDIEKRLTYVSVHGGDGRFHDVPVEWDEYLPLEQEGYFYITNTTHEMGRFSLAKRGDACICPLDS